MATSLVEYYVRGFGSESLFGLRLIISWTSGLVFLWMLGLAYLVWRANSKAIENRFMSVLLICEGIKATFIMTDAVPYESHWEWIWDYLIFVKIDLFFMAHLTAIVLYFCIPIYYRVNSLSFLYKEKLQKHAWYLAPIIGITLWFSISGHPLFNLEKSAWLICTEAGATPYLQEWFGGIPEAGPEALTAIGTCPAYLNIHVSQEPLGLWGIALISPLISIIALLFYRSSMKGHLKGENPDVKKSLTSRSLYIGFLGKVISNMIYFSTVILIIPLLHGGPAGFVDASMWQWGENPDFMNRLKYFVWTFGLIFVPLGMGFEALMFVHASLKDTVFGIDKTLRKTFSTAVFTGIGATLFVLGSEAMENALGFGMSGGVLIGVGLLAVRKPLIGLIDGFSNRLIPSEYSPEETEYLEQYAKSMKDGSITENERSLLVTLASAYGINSERVTQIETSFSSNNSEESVIEEKIIEVIQQWTDDSGYTWRKMSDGSTQWWNGTDWQDYT
ncbi:MAG: hypothetical protein CMB72_02965 [Euryarchaeota archaeon]|nr:hypothetical protein [Euryarchaeota archaeon]